MNNRTCTKPEVIFQDNLERQMEFVEQKVKINDMNALTISCICIAGAGLLLAIISIPFSCTKNQSVRIVQRKQRGRL